MVTVMMMMMMMMMRMVTMMVMMMMIIIIMTPVSVEQRPGWGEHVLMELPQVVYNRQQTDN